MKQRSAHPHFSLASLDAAWINAEGKKAQGCKKKLNEAELLSQCSENGF